MKKLLYLFALIAVLVASCAEDEGNYSYKTLPLFTVDTTGLGKKFMVTQFDRFTLASHLQYDGDKSDLDYAWCIYSSESGQEDNPSDTLSTKEDLDVEITEKPGNYYLEFTATNRQTGLKAMTRYRLTVESFVGTGLMVFYQKDDVNDVDIIKSPAFNGALTEGTVTRKLYSRLSNSVPLPGQPKTICVTGNYINLFTDKTGVRVSNDDMSPIDTYQDMFITRPDTLAFQSYTHFSGSDVIVNNGKIYCLLYNWARGDLRYPSPKVLMNGCYVASLCVCSAYAGGLLGYDLSHDRFLYGTMYSSEVEAIPSEGLYDTGRHPIYMAPGFSNVANSPYDYAVMQSDNNPADLHLYAVSVGRTANQNKLVNDFDLSSCPGIQQAELYSASMVAPILYYSTPKSLYVASYSLSESSVVAPSAPSWTAPANEEITSMTLFTNKGIDLDESAANKYIIVTTWNGNEGKVYILKADLATGVVNANPVEEYGGFGKICGVSFKSE